MTSFSIPPTAELTDDDLRRYARHIILREVGEEGQRRIKSASVLIVGVGGIGSPAALYLAAAGVGRIGIVDADRVDESNLQRQVLYSTPQVGKPKVEAARERLHNLNPKIQIDAYNTRFTAENADQLAADYDILVDGSDNFATRYAINAAAVRQSKPYVYGAIHEYDGQVSVFYTPEGPCYNCVFPKAPEEVKGVRGVLGALPGVVGTLEAAEALKLILGVGEPLIGKLLLYNLFVTSFDIIKLRKNPECEVCGNHDAQNNDARCHDAR